MFNVYWPVVYYFFTKIFTEFVRKEIIFHLGKNCKPNNRIVLIDCQAILFINWCTVIHNIIAWFLASEMFYQFYGPPRNFKELLFFMSPLVTACSAWDHINICTGLTLNSIDVLVFRHLQSWLATKSLGKRKMLNKTHLTTNNHTEHTVRLFTCY